MPTLPLFSAPSPARLCTVAAALLLAGCRDGAEPSGVAGRRATALRPAALRPSAAPSVVPVAPGRPSEVDDSTVRAELSAARRGAHPPAHDFARLVAAFGDALTTRGLNHLAAAALASAGGDRGPRAEALRARVRRAYNGAAPGVGPLDVLGFAGPGACDVGFDSPEVLASFPDKVEAIFSSPPHWRQACGTGHVVVEPLVHGHYHLAYEDPTIDCIDVENTGRFGRGEPGACTPLADPAQEPRYLGTHLGTEVLRIRRRVGGANAPFTLHSFAVLRPTAVKVRYRTGNGPWMQWDALAGPAVYDVSAYAVGVTEVQVTNAGTSFACGPDFKAAGPGPCPADYTPYFVDDFSISP
jgi:hypothetical protein